MNAKFYYIDGAELLTQKRYGEPEEMVRKAFSEAKINSPAVLYLDRLDQFLDKSDYDNNHINRTIFQILTLLDNIASHDRIMVIGSASSDAMINSSFRESGRFDFEFVFEIPDRNERLDLLFQFTRKVSLAKDVDLNIVADRTIGYSTSELQKIIRIASTHAMERSLDNTNKDKLNSCPLNNYFEISPHHNTSNGIIITMNDLLFSIDKSRNNVKCKIDKPLSNSKWEEIGGLNETLNELIQDIEWPLKYPKFYKDMGLRSPRGILLYGPPGTGKTSIARAIASTCQANFINIKGPELISKWIGDSEKGIRDTFKKARENAPCIIFFDEIDAIATARDSDIDNSGVTHRMISQLLTEMDGLEVLDGVTVIGATNRIDVIDKALLRPGRFDKVFNISPPNEHSRVDILKILTKDIKLAKDVDLKSIARITEKFTGAELFGLITEAKKISLNEHLVNYDIKKNEEYLE